MLDIDLTGRVALVTGGSRGIGRAAALTLARAGARVAIGYRDNETAAAETLRLVHEAGGEAIAQAADLATAEGCRALHEAAVAQLGKIDILLNNAGAPNTQVFMTIDDETFLASHAINQLSVVRMSRLVAPGMMARKWGRIVNISSIATRLPGVGLSSYGAAKAGVESLTRSLAIELSRRNINVNCLCPGLIDTDMSKETRQQVTENTISHQLVQRLGTTEEVAGWILMLTSQHGDFMSGQVLYLDGGLGLH